MGFIFLFASSMSKNSARSISGNSCFFPERGGHSIVNVLLLVAAGSQSPSNAHAWTALPPFCINVPSTRNSSCGGNPSSQFFLKLPLRGHEIVLARPDLPLGDAPRCRVPVRPYRPAGMDEQDLKRTASHPIHDEARTDSRHTQSVAEVGPPFGASRPLRAANTHTHPSVRQQPGN